MSNLGKRMIQSAAEALAFAEGGPAEGFEAHRFVDVRALRLQLKMAQPEFAARYGLSVGTVRDWEQGRTVPERPAQVLLRIIAAEPEMVQRVLGTSQRKRTRNVAQ